MYILVCKNYNYFSVVNCKKTARLHILLLSSGQSSEISARHRMQHSPAAVGFSFISHFLPVLCYC